MPKFVTDPTAPIITMYSGDPTEPENVKGTIAIVMRDYMKGATAMSLIMTALHGPHQNLGSINVTMIQGNVLILQRNEAVQNMLGEWLMFIDDDMAWQPDQIKQLIECRDELDLDMVGALCFRRGEPYQPTLYMREERDRGRYTTIEKWDTDLVEVDATGMAFIIIHKRVFERIAEANGERFPSFKDRKAGPPPEYFRWIGRTGEDLRFCQDAKEAGCRVFVNTKIEVGHVGEKSFGHKDFLFEVAQRDQEADDERRKQLGDMGFEPLTAQEARKMLGFE